MKIMVLNSSGNVGKSTVVRELLYPRLQDCKIIEVETVNKSTKDFDGFDGSVMQFKAGESFDKLYLWIIENENVILDIGASSLGEFWRELKKVAGIEMLFDVFVIPSIPADKQMTDTFKTIQFLRNNNIEDEKIKVIFNKVKTSVKQDFSALLDLDFDFDEELYIKDTNLFSDLGLLKKSIKDVYHPDLNYFKERILSSKDPAEKLMLVKMDIANRMAHSVIEDFDYIFEKITGLKSANWCSEDDGAVEKEKKDVKNEEVQNVENESAVSEDDEEL